MRRILLLAPAILLAAACGKDEQQPTPYQGWQLEDLTDAEGFSLRLPEEDVAPATESQNCYFIQVPDINNGQDFMIERVHAGINPGSHHMNVFRVNTIVPKDPNNVGVGLGPDDGEPIMIGQYPATLLKGYADFAHSPCWKSSNWADWPLVANSQNSSAENPYTDWKLPAGVGIKLHPGEMLMIQTHYVNTSVQPTPFKGKVGINFHKYMQSAEAVEMGSLFATQQSIRICRSTPTANYSGSCRFPSGQVTINAVNGHFHSRGRTFKVYSWDGMSDEYPADTQKFYESDHWDDPPMVTTLAVQPPIGGGVWWNCGYQWAEPPYPGSCEEVDAKDPQHAGDCCYTFGGNTDVGEHCNLFMYYYPRLEQHDVFCN